MNRPYKFLAHLALGLAFISGSAAWAMPGEKEYGRKSDKMEAHMKKMEEKLNLTPEQKTKLDATRKNHREEARKLWDAMKEKRKALATELEKETFSVDVARKFQEELKVLQAHMADLRFKKIIEVRQILSAEQFKKMHEFKRDRKGPHEGGPKHP
jgi:Spy/CpxP family protein refolding chaperone